MALLGDHRARAGGTFLSVKLGDGLLDFADNKLHHNNGKTPTKLKIKFIALLALIAVIIFIYYDVLKTLGIELPE